MNRPESLHQSCPNPFFYFVLFFFFFFFFFFLAQLRAILHCIIQTEPCYVTTLSSSPSANQTIRGTGDTVCPSLLEGHSSAHRCVGYRHDCGSIRWQAQDPDGFRQRLSTPKKTRPTPVDLSEKKVSQYVDDLAKHEFADFDLK